MTAIGLISDVHATPSPIEEALSIFKQAGVDQILCAGDMAGYGDKLEQSIALLVDRDCQTILGNHDLLYLDRHAHEVDNLAVAYFRQLTTSLCLTICGHLSTLCVERSPVRVVSYRLVTAAPLVYNCLLTYYSLNL